MQVLMLLRRAGGDVNVLNNLGVTPLAYACMFPLSVEVSVTLSLDVAQVRPAAALCSIQQACLTLLRSCIYTYIHIYTHTP
jgi:hypothetical protein